MPNIKALCTGRSFSKISKLLLASLFQRNSPCYIMRLPLDIHVDQIFLYLFIEDILRLRRVNRAFFLLTHEPVIWKRFLRHVRTPIPHIRPTFRYTDDPMDSEVEQLVIRTVSFEDNWRHPIPRIASTKVVPTQYVVFELKLVPGGKYLIASVGDVSSCYFFLMVYCLDHPSGPFPLARLETESKTFNLDAKYMVYENKDVLMVGFVQRYYKKRVNDNASTYSTKHRIDPPYSMEQEIRCFYLDLAVLDALSDPFLVPRSNDWVALASLQGDPCVIVQSLKYSLKRQIEPDSLSFFQVNGVPHLAAINLDRTMDVEGRVYLFSTITFADLTKPDEMVFLTLKAPEGYEGLEFRIRAVRKLPNQSHLLVIRTVERDSSSHHYLLEMYDLTTLGNNTLSPVSTYALDTSGNIATRFHISDYGNPSSNSDEWKIAHDCHPPTPISIYMETQTPEDSIKHWIVWPSYFAEHQRYYYDLRWVALQTKHQSWAHTHINGGAYRSIAYTVSSTDRTDTPSLMELRRYMNPELQMADYPIPRVSRTTRALAKPMLLRPHNPYCTLKMDPAMLSRYAALGVAAIAWDEGSGRLCMASGETLQIDFLDFGWGNPPDNRAVQWKETLDILAEVGYQEITPSPDPDIHLREPQIPGEWSAYTKYSQLGKIPV